MTYQRIKALVDRKPFLPFSLHLADGDVVLVKSQEFIWLHPSKRVAFIATGAEEEAPDRIVDLLLVAQVSTTNGFDASVTGPVDDKADPQR